MKKVSGYLSTDDMFFDTPEGAIRHDAELLIIAYCTEHDIDQAKVFPIIEALAEPITRYVHAQVAQIKTPKNSKARSLDQHLIDTFRQEASSTVFEQSPNGHKPVPDVGSGT